MTKRCLKCKTCQHLTSAWSCSCGLRYEDHVTIMETRQERIVNGRATTEVEQILNDNMLVQARVPGEIRGFMDVVDHADRFGAQVEDFERRQLEGQHRAAIAMVDDRKKGGVSSKMLMNGMNMLESAGSNSKTGVYGNNKFGNRRQVNEIGNIAERTQQSLERIETECSALSLFKKKHRFGKY